MIILLNGCINVGKSSVAQALTRLLPNTAHVELDDLRRFYAWMPLAEAIPITLETAGAVTRVLVDRRMNAVLTWPLREEDYAYLIAHLEPLGVPIHAVTLDAKPDTLFSDRGGRELTKWERSRIAEMLQEGYHQRSFGTVIDTTGRIPEETALRVLEIVAGLPGPQPDKRHRAGKRLGAAAIIRNARGRVLLVKHSYGKLNWEIPGGAAEAGESVAGTAIREVLEETGLRVIAERVTGIYYMAENDSHHFVFTCVSQVSDQPPRSVSEETTDCGYFAPDALPRPVSDFTVRRIQDALADQTPLLPFSIGPRLWLE